MSSRHPHRSHRSSIASGSAGVVAARIGPGRLRAALDPIPRSGVIDLAAARRIDTAAGYSGAGPSPRAAVAAVFREGEEGTELLFIQRAAKPSDPWSGQMAFPGGRVDPPDRDTFHTAERETLEEVGLDLSLAVRLGSLTELDGGRATNRLVTVQAHAFWLEGPRPRLQGNYEVADVLWLPLAELLDHRRYIDYIYPVSGGVFPGIDLDKESQVIWGLTLRFLSDLFARLDQPFIGL